VPGCAAVTLAVAHCAEAWLMATGCVLEIPMSPRPVWGWPPQTSGSTSQ
jgi:hypothetical protein